jgi:hypothetical protein
MTSSGWTNYATVVSWTLKGDDGNKIVSAQFRDSAGNVSEPVTDTIILDRVPPTATIGALSRYQNTTTFPVTLVGSDPISGIASYDVDVRDGQTGAWTGWLTGVAETTLSFSGQHGHTYSFRVRARDNAGNVGSYSSGDNLTTVDTVPPTTSRFLINFGALETTTADVSISIDAADALSTVTEMSFSNDGTTWSDWKPYKATAFWSLSSGNGQKTVYGRFRDAAENTSAFSNDTIVLNTFIPTDYGLTVNKGALFTNKTAVTLTIGAKPGTTQIQVSNDGGFAGATWEPYTSQRPWEIEAYGRHILPRIVYIRYKDQSGEVSSIYQDDIVLDLQPPRGHVEIAVAQILAGDDVLLHLEADDDVSGVGEMLVSNQASFVGTSWQPFAPQLGWDIGSGNTVYVQFRDNAGNISQTYLATLSNYNVHLPSIKH